MVLVPAVISLAQTTETVTRTLLPAGSARPDFHGSHTKATTCGIDTILYPYLKELTFAAPADSFFIDAMVGNVREASQAYHIDEEILVHGVQFWGGAYSTSPAPQTLAVRVYLNAVDAFNMPTARLDSADVIVANGDAFYTAMFATPHAYDENFSVSVRSIPNDTLTVITNNAGNTWTPNYGESLAWRRFGSGVWNSTLSFFSQDLEYMIFPIVSYDLAASFTTDGPSECTGTEAEFTNTSSSIYSNRMLNLHAFDEYWGFAAADSTFTWEYGDGSPDESAMQGSNTYTIDSTFNVILTGELLGYYSTCTDWDTVSVMVLETPAAALNVTGTVAFCEGGAIGLTASPATDVTYQWLMDGALVPDSTGGTFLLSEAGDYAVIATNVCGTDTSATVTAAIAEEPVAGIDLTGTVEICEGELTEFTATPASGVDYQWLLDGAPVTDSTFSTYQTGAVGDYSVIVSNTCGSDTSEVVSVAVNSEPETSMSVSGDLTFCEGGSVMLMAMPASGVSYEWLMNGATVADSVDGTFTVTESGEYTVIASNGCGLDTAVSVTVEVNALPQVPEIIETDGVLEVDSLTVMPGYLYQWQADEADIPGATTDTLVPLANGTYTVIVTNANGCTNTSEPFEVDYMSTTELETLSFIVAPNPSNGTFTVTYDPALGFRFELYDAQGKLVDIDPVIQAGQQHTAQFMVDHLNDGVYLLRAFAAAGTATERIVIQH